MSFQHESLPVSSKGAPAAWLIIAACGAAAVLATTVIILVLSSSDEAPTLAIRPINPVDVSVGDFVSFVAELESAADWRGRVSFGLGEKSPSGAHVDAMNGWFTWVPNAPGRYEIELKAAALDGAASDVQTFVVNVAALPVAELPLPKFEVQPLYVVDEETLLRVRLFGPDARSEGFLVEFVGDAPDGADLHRDAGEFVWMPKEAHGPGDYAIRLRAKARDADAPSVEASFIVQVREVNQPPKIETFAVGDAFIRTPLRVRIPATDDDMPPNVLKFELSQGPPGAQIDDISGELMWTPSLGDLGTTHDFRIRVSDQDLLSDPVAVGETTFRVVVREPSDLLQKERFDEAMQRSATKDPSCPVPVSAIAVFGHTGVNRFQGYGPLAFTPDGRQVAATSRFEIVLLDAETGELLRSLPMDPPGAEVMVISPDGQTLAAASRDGVTLEGPGAAVRWNLKTGEKISELPGGEEENPAITLSPDGRMLARSSFHGNSATLYDLETGRAAATLRGHEWQIVALAFDAHNARIATGDSAGGIRIWDVAAAKTLHAITLESGVEGLAFNPDGRLLAASEKDSITLWNTGDATQFARLEGHPVPAPDLVFSTDGKSLASASNKYWGVVVRAELDDDPEPVRVWDVDRKQRLCSLAPPLPSYVSSVAFRPGSRTIAATTGRQIEYRSMDTGALTNRQPAPEFERQYEYDFDATGTLLAIVLREGRHELWDFTREERIRVLHDKPGKFERPPNLGPHGSYLIQVDRTGRIDLLDPRSGRLRHSLKSHQSQPFHFAASANGSVLASAGRKFASDGKTPLDKSFVFRLGDPLQVVPFPGHKTEITTMAISPDGSRLATGCESERHVRVWDTKTGEQVAAFREHGPKWYRGIRALSFSGDGKRLAWLTKGKLANDLSEPERNDLMLRLWTIGEDKEVSITFNEEIADDGYHTLFHPVENFVFVSVNNANDASAVIVVDATTEQIVHRIAGVYFHAPPRISPTGRFLAFSTSLGDPLWVVSLDSLKP